MRNFMMAAVLLGLFAGHSQACGLLRSLFGGCRQSQSQGCQPCQGQPVAQSAPQYVPVVVTPVPQLEPAVNPAPVPAGIKSVVPDVSVTPAVAPVAYAAPASYPVIVSQSPCASGNCPQVQQTRRRFGFFSR